MLSLQLLNAASKELYNVCRGPLRQYTVYMACAGIHVLSKWRHVTMYMYNESTKVQNPRHCMLRVREALTR